MAISATQQRKYLSAAAIVLAVAAGAYTIGRVYPPFGPSAGTIGPADRYVAAQVGAGDVTLGDTAIPKLMQTDAFEVMVKNPSFRALAADPGFAALASNSQAMAALAANPAAFQALARNPQAFQATLRSAGTATVEEQRKQAGNR